MRSILFAENFYWGEGGRRCKERRLGLVFPAEAGAATAGCHFRMWRWGRLGDTRTLDARVRARRAAETKRWRGLRSRRRGPAAGLRALAGLLDGGRTPRSQNPHATPSGLPRLGWSQNAIPFLGLRLRLPPRLLVVPSFAPRLSSFALTKASLGAFLPGAILPDSMFSCRSSSGERRLLASSSLWLHPWGVRKAGLPRRPAGRLRRAAPHPWRGGWRAYWLWRCGQNFLENPWANTWKSWEAPLPSVILRRSAPKGPLLSFLGPLLPPPKLPLWPLQFPWNPCRGPASTGPCGRVVRSKAEHGLNLNSRSTTTSLA